MPDPTIDQLLKELRHANKIALDTKQCFVEACRASMAARDEASALASALQAKSDELLRCQHELLATRRALEDATRERLLHFQV